MIPCIFCQKSELILVKLIMKRLMKMLIVTCLVLFLGVGCEEENPVQNSKEPIGSWQLAYYQTEENGRINDPNDGKPVYWNFKSDSTYEGMAGNNEILGNYRIMGDSLLFTLNGSEMIGTEWEERFYDALNQSWNGEKYAMPYELENNELILNYVGNDTMHFLPKE